MSLSLSQILSNWLAGQTPKEIEYQQLAIEALADKPRAQAFGITPLNVETIILERTKLFQAIATEVLSLPSLQKQEAGGRRQEAGGEGGGSVSDLGKKSTKQQVILSLWNLWLPLAMQLALSRQQLCRPLIQGILGGQGTGKTTLATVLRLILTHLGYQTLSLSIDDIYKTYEERQQLQQQDPRLIWRGPPGTHDIELGLQLLEQLRQPNPAAPIAVPRFNKSAWGGIGDRSGSELVENVDIVLFEGWLVGVQPVDPAVFEGNTPAPIQTPADRSFAREMNERLRDYLPLWEYLDRLIVLYPVDYRLSKQWRLQAERDMIATGKSGMSDDQISQFVEYFWKSLHPELFITPLTRNPSLVDLVVEINPDHTPAAVYSKRQRAEGREGRRKRRFK
ncbi:MAG: glycerate kinase [Symploca sp. SIO3E6]|nr:glycerate kinase [Caldora sp. SIO3E6]